MYICTYVCICAHLQIPTYTYTYIYDCIIRPIYIYTLYVHAYICLFHVPIYVLYIRTYTHRQSYRTYDECISDID